MSPELEKIIIEVIDKSEAHAKSLVPDLLMALLNRQDMKELMHKVPYHTCSNCNPNLFTEKYRAFALTAMSAIADNPTKMESLFLTIYYEGMVNAILYMKDKKELEELNKIYGDTQSQ